MQATVNLSLPPEQLMLLEKVAALQEQLINFHISGSWLTEKEAAQRLKVTECDIRTWRLEGWLRFHQVDDQIRYKTDELDIDFQDQAKITARTTANFGAISQGNPYLEHAKQAGSQFIQEAHLKGIKRSSLTAAHDKANSRKLSRP